MPEFKTYMYMWRARFGRGFGPVVRQTTKWMNVYVSGVHSFVWWIHFAVHTLGTKSVKIFADICCILYGILYMFSPLKPACCCYTPTNKGNWNVRSVWTCCVDCTEDCSWVWLCTELCEAEDSGLLGRYTYDAVNSSLVLISFE
jgi:hypothetical protein